jgi:hypothetical protein
LALFHGTYPWAKLFFCEHPWAKLNEVKGADWWKAFERFMMASAKAPDYLKDNLSDVKAVVEDLVGVRNARLRWRKL